MQGLFVAARIAILVIACALLTFTTPVSGLMEGLLWILGPLRKVRVPVDDLAMVISLALRFVPGTADEAYALRSAQMARGADFESGSFLRRIKAWIPVFVPLIVRMFRRADELSRAMEARCYSNAPRTNASARSIGTRPLIETAAGLLVLVLLCAFL